MSATKKKQAAKKLLYFRSTYTNINHWQNKILCLLKIDFDKYFSHESTKTNIEQYRKKYNITQQTSSNIALKSNWFRTIALWSKYIKRKYVSFKSLLWMWQRVSRETSSILTNKEKCRKTWKKYIICYKIQTLKQYPKYDQYISFFSLFSYNTTLGYVLLYIFKSVCSVCLCGGCFFCCCWCFVSTVETGIK